MADDLRFVLTIVAALGCGLVGGIFFGFSAFIMKALARLGAGQGIAAMQSINVAVINPWFLSVFLGTGAACLVLGGWSLWEWSRPGTICVASGSVLYLVGTFVVTIACNVPWNDRLAGVEPASPAGAPLWAQYVNSWTRWNHVRTAAALVAAAALLMTALCLFENGGPG